VAELDTEPHPTLHDAVRLLVVFGTLGTIAWIAFDLVSVAFRLGARIGIRSAVALALPILAGGYAFVYHAGTLRRIRDWPAAVRFTASLVAGALIAAALRSYLVLYPILIVELWVASCLAMLAFASDAVPGLALDEPRARSDRPLAPFYGLAAGVLLYSVLFGVPRIVPG